MRVSIKKNLEFNREKTLYIKRSMDNLRETSRTAYGKIDTSSSQQKDLLMADICHDEVLEKTIKNYSDVIAYLYDAKDQRFDSWENLQSFIENIAITITDGVLNKDKLIRKFDSEKYPYTLVSDLPKAMENFYRTLHLLLAKMPQCESLEEKTQWVIETGAWIEYRLNLTDHFFSDGCGKTASALFVFLCMRANCDLPAIIIPDGNNWENMRKDFLPTKRKGGDDEDADMQFKKWLEFFEIMFKHEKHISKRFYSDHNHELSLFHLHKELIILILSSPILSGKDLVRASAVCVALRNIIKNIDFFRRKIQLEKPAFQIAVSYMGAIFVWSFSKPAALYGAGPLKNFSSCTLPKELVKIQQVCASPYRAYVYGKDSEGNGLLASARITRDRRGQNLKTIEVFTLVNPGFSKIFHITAGGEYTMVCGADVNGKPQVSLMSSTASSEQGMAHLPDTFATLVQASADGGISESLLLGKDQNGELVLASGGRGLRIYDPVDKPGIHVTPFSILKIPPKFAHVDQIIARGSFKVLLGRNLIGSPLLAISGLVPQNFVWPDPMRYRKDFEFIDLPREFVRIDQLVVNLENERSHAFRNEYLSRLLIHGADMQERPLLAQWRKDSSTGGPIFEFVKLPGFFASLIQVIPGSVKMPDICIPKLFSLYLIAYGRDLNGNSQLAASGCNDSAGFRWKKSKELTLFRLPACLLSEIEILEFHKEAILKLAIENSIHEIKIFGKHIGQEVEMQAGINFIIIPNVRMTSWDQRNFEQSVAGLLKMSVQVFTPNELVDLANDAIITAEQCEAYLKNAIILEDFLSAKESQKMFSH